MSAGIIASQAFNPTKIADLNLDLDASDLSTIIEDDMSGAVSRWFFKGRKDSIIQFPGSSQPFTGVSTINGKNVLSFDGISQNLSRAITLSSPSITLFIVFKAISIDVLLDSVVSLNKTNDFQIEAGIEGEFRALLRSSGLGGSVPQPQHSSNLLGIPSLINYRFSVNDGDVVLRVNGVQSDTDTYNGALDLNQVLHLGFNRAADHKLNVDLGQVTLYNRDLTLPEMLEVEKYLINRWDITTPLTSIFTPAFAPAFS